MAHIDTEKPIRMKGPPSKRLFINWIEWSGPDQGKFWVSGRDGSGRRGFRYNRNGTPVDPNPWGDIENFTEGSPFEFVEEVTPDQAYAPEKLAAKRQAMNDALADELEGTDFFGIF